jgi:predicted RNA-binding protein with EMAP domain
MDQKTKLILALMQIENVRKLLQEGQYAGFFTSHLLPVKYEIERQLTNLTGHNKYIKIEE